MSKENATPQSPSAFEHSIAPPTSPRKPFVKKIAAESPALFRGLFKASANDDADDPSDDMLLAMSGAMAKELSVALKAKASAETRAAELAARGEAKDRALRQAQALLREAAANRPSPSSKARIQAGLNSLTTSMAAPQTTLLGLARVRLAKPGAHLAAVRAAAAAYRPLACAWSAGRALVSLVVAALAFGWDAIAHLPRALPGGAALSLIAQLYVAVVVLAALYTTTEHYEWARWAVDSSAALAGWGGRALLRATPPVVGRATDLLAAGGATSATSVLLRTDSLAAVAAIVLDPPLHLVAAAADDVAAVAAERARAAVADRPRLVEKAHAAVAALGEARVRARAAAERSGAAAAARAAGGSLARGGRALAAGAAAAGRALAATEHGAAAAQALDEAAAAAATTSIGRTARRAAALAGLADDEAAQGFAAVWEYAVGGSGSD